MHSKMVSVFDSASLLNFYSVQFDVPSPTFQEQKHFKRKR